MQGGDCIGDGAQGEGADDVVEAGVLGLNLAQLQGDLDFLKLDLFFVNLLSF